MDPTESNATPGGKTATPPLQTAQKRYLGSQDSGIYASDAEHILDGFREFATGHSYRRAGQLDKALLTEWATTLRQRVDREEIAASTAWNYFHVVSAFCTYCVRRDWLATNPALKEAPKQELPAESTDPTAEQRWSRHARVNIVRWADWRAEDAIDHGWMDGETAVRDRALVALFGYTGVRGAELLRDSRDPDRDGLRWRDVDLKAGTMRVLGKRKRVEHVGMHETARTYLRAHRRRQDPTSDAWPVFATRHRPTLSKTLPDGVDASGDALAACRKHDVVPPAVSTSGGRRICETLSVESGLRGSDGEVLKPHAARRGLGKELYQQAPEKAQQQLRHQDIATTNKHYNDVEAVEQKESLDEMID